MGSTILICRCHKYNEKSHRNPRQHLVKAGNGLTGGSEENIPLASKNYHSYEGKDWADKKKWMLNITRNIWFLLCVTKIAFHSEASWL